MPDYDAVAGWPYLGGMGKLILGLLAAFVVLMLALAVIHVIMHVFLYVFVFALIVIVGTALFKVGRWSRDGSREG